MTVKPIAGRRPAVAVLFAALAFVCAGSGAPLAQEPPAAAAQPVAAKPRGVPIALDGETLFYVTKGVGPFTAEDRAVAAERRLSLIASDPFYSVALFRIVAKPNQSEIYYRDHLVGIITEQDTASTGGTADEAAAALVQKVNDSVTRFRERRAPLAWTRAGIIMGVATLMLAVLVTALRRARRRLETLIETRRAAVSPRRTGGAAGGGVRAEDRADPVEGAEAALFLRAVRRDRRLSGRRLRDRADDQGLRPGGDRLRARARPHACGRGF